MILIDSQEPIEVLNAFRLNKMEFKQEQLRVNDERVCDFTTPEHKFAIERKTAADFCSSVFDGRLQKQADLMEKYYACNRIFIIEGNLFYESSKHPKGRNLIISWVGKLIERGFTVLMSNSTNETAQHIYWLDHSISKGNALKANIAELPKSGNDRLDGLLVIPHLGAKKADTLLKNRPDLTLYELCRISHVNHPVIEGFGNKTWEAIYKHFHDPIIPRESK